MYTKRASLKDKYHTEVFNEDLANSRSKALYEACKIVKPIARKVLGPDGTVDYQDRLHLLCKTLTFYPNLHVWPVLEDADNYCGYLY